MTIDAWLRENILRLKQAGIETARLDCLVLLSDEIDCDKSWILAHAEHELQIEQINILNTFIAQRAAHTPLAYIRGKSEFYGREFKVNTAVLVPRPESEDMLDMLKIVAVADQKFSICDIGTGSGALGITAKLEFPSAEVLLTDIDQSCLNVAKINATTLHADVAFLQGDLLQPLRSVKFGNPELVLIANLPYVPIDHIINQAATHEPSHALFSGVDGLDHYRQMFSELEVLPTLPTHIITESFTSQHTAMAKLANKYQYEIQAISGLVQLFTSPN